MRLQWRIFVPFFVSTLLALVASAWFANHSLRAFYQQQVALDLQTRAHILAREVETLVRSHDLSAVDQHCKDFGRLTQTRVTVVLPDGRVAGDSEHDPAIMENHRMRPEIAKALQGRTGQSVRFSDTIRRTLMYLAVPIQQDGTVIAVVRTALPLAILDWTLHSAYRNVTLSVGLIAAFFAVIALYLARRVSRPLDDMRRTAERLAQGDLQARVSQPPGEEMESLARALNQMALQLGERMNTITRQNDQQKAVFSSMVEGVLAVDSEARILELNAAAARLLELSPETSRGRSIHETVRNVDLQNFIAHTLKAGGPAEADIILYGNEERFLQLHGTALTDARDRHLGALVVLNDITRVKRLETVRQDFVANVSHELKTPITALRGCVETLSGKEPHTPEDETRFIAMMGRQVERLSAIVEDLLSLSRIEHDAQRKRIPLEPGPIADVVRRAVQALSRTAAAKGIALEVQVPTGLTAPINAALLEEAVGNLIDNAIKYSTDGTRVEIAATPAERTIDIRVADQGPGIEKRHLSRIFERFYRVDQARSRALGGTGLGLAIVKHIMLAHGGSVSVESTPGKGSAFTLHVPTTK
jgi:two-component system phosphate regulon sensor histidine kinase PhoR